MLVARREGRKIEANGGILMEEEGFEYPVVKNESFILSDASATPLYWKSVWRKCATGS